jgi:hypothetical protein
MCHQRARRQEPDACGWERRDALMEFTVSRDR